MDEMCNFRISYINYLFMDLNKHSILCLLVITKICGVFCHFFEEENIFHFLVKRLFSSIDTVRVCLLWQRIYILMMFLAHFEVKMLSD